MLGKWDALVAPKVRAWLTKIGQFKIRRLEVWILEMKLWHEISFIPRFFNIILWRTEISGNPNSEQQNFRSEISGYEEFIYFLVLMFVTDMRGKMSKTDYFFLSRLLDEICGQSYKFLLNLFFQNVAEYGVAVFSFFIYPSLYSLQTSAVWNSGKKYAKRYLAE